MTDRKRADTSRRRLAVAIAASTSLLWLAGVGALLWALGSDSALWLAVAVAVALPLVAIWFAALLARQSTELQREADRLAEAAEALRRAADSAKRASERTARTPAPEAAAAPPPPMRLQPGPPPMRLVPASATPAAAPEPRQESLPLPVQAEGPRIALPDLTRALDFPESAEDKAGFRALRLALDDPRTGRLVQASQDMLTLLSEEGIYMDDLDPDRARPEIWRRFAEGDRGPSVAKVGGIRDRSSLALTAARMRTDPVFRDAAHHFLRLFDRTLAELAPDLTDAELAALAETRTARAFMLIGRVAGIFH